MCSRSPAADGGLSLSSASSRGFPKSRSAGDRAFGGPVGVAEQDVAGLEGVLSNGQRRIGVQSHGRAGGGQLSPGAGCADDKRRFVAAVDIGEQTGFRAQHAEKKRGEHAQFIVILHDVIVGQSDGFQRIGVIKYRVFFRRCVGMGNGCCFFRW